MNDEQEEEFQNCTKFIVFIFMLMTIFIITIPFIFVITERWEVSNNQRFEEIVSSYQTLPIQEAFLQSISFTQKESVTFRPYACLFKANDSVYPFFSKYIEYDGYDYLTAKNCTQFERDWVWKLQMVIFEVQLVFMRILNSLEPPVSRITKELLLINNFTDELDKTVNCYNPLDEIEKEAFNDISNITLTWLQLSPIYHDQKLHLNATIQTVKNFFRERIQASERDTQTFINIVALSISTILIMGTIIMTQYCYYFQLKKHVRPPIIPPTEITPLLKNNNIRTI